jgi:hypothetical protein
MLSTYFTAAKVAELFAVMICKLHGMPRSIVSDRDPIFLSHFWQELFKLSGTKLRMSTAYHPQSDGQTEIVNKVLQQYLRCFVHNKPKQWGQYLHWAEWHYNTSIHTATGFSPFQIVYGRPPPTLSDYIPGSTQLQAVEATLLDRDSILQILKNKLQKAQSMMKTAADQHRISHKFAVGDFAFVKLRPYRQISVAGRRVHKLSKRYYGPYKLIKAIGEVAFQLELPPTSKIHPVFHVSQLKPCLGDTAATLDLPPTAEENHPVIQPLSVLDWKYNTEATEWQVLIQWEGLFPEDSTWESYQEILTNCPAFHLEDKVTLDPPGNVMTQDESNGPTNENVVMVPPPKDKRNVTLPPHFKDFVMPAWKKGNNK